MTDQKVNISYKTSLFKWISDYNTSY